MFRSLMRHFIMRQDNENLYFILHILKIIYIKNVLQAFRLSASSHLDLSKF